MRSKNIFIYIYIILKQSHSDLDGISLHFLFPFIVFFAVSRMQISLTGIKSKSYVWAFKS